MTGQPIDAQVELVPASFIETNEEWNAWWAENRDRLEWNESRETYVVKEAFRSR